MRATARSQVAIVGAGVPARFPRTGSTRTRTTCWLIIRTLVDGPDDVAAVAARVGPAMWVEAAARGGLPASVAPAREPTPEARGGRQRMLERNPPGGAMARARARQPSRPGSRPTARAAGTDCRQRATAGAAA